MNTETMKRLLTTVQPHLRGNLYVAFLVTAAVAIVFAASRASGSVEGYGAILVGIGLLIRQEYSDRRARQGRSTLNGKLDETSGKLDDIKTTALSATTAAETAASEVKKTAAVLVKQTNGELDAKIVNAVTTVLSEKLPQAVAAAVDAAMKPLHARLDAIGQKNDKL